MRIIVVAPNASFRLGGEAIKALQFFRYLLDRGFDAHLLTHERNKAELTSTFDGNRLRFVSDSMVQGLMWKSKVFRILVNVIFHLRAAQLLRRETGGSTIAHYISPISPIQPRFPPVGPRIVIGPVNGNIQPPRGFRHRVKLVHYLSALLHVPLQRILGRVMGDKKRADWLLNSGGDRTRRSLLAAGARKEQIVDVLDAGVDVEPGAVEWTERDPFAFCCVARLDHWKGVDLAIRAMALLPEHYRLTVLGSGLYFDDLVRLRDELNLQGRVDLAGYTARDKTLSILGHSQALVFPSFNEANGIAIQEAMCLGTPVIALDHGGPAILLAEGRGFLVSPVTEEQIVNDLADRMTRVVDQDHLARDAADKALTHAKREFGWEAVASRWTSVYDLPKVTRDASHPETAQPLDTAPPQ